MILSQTLKLKKIITLSTLIYFLLINFFCLQAKNLPDCDFESGIKHNCYGEYTFPKELNYYAKKFIGNWKNNQPDGYGHMIYNDNGKYTGNFKNGSRHGKGKMIYPGNTLFKKSKISVDKDLYILEYIGDWKNNQMSGRGKITFSNAQYVGEMRNDQMNFYGIIRYDNGDKYYGSWEENDYHDKGTKIYNNNTKYVGWWRDDLFFNQGKFYYANGDTYEGAWQFGKRVGFGKITYNNGNILYAKFSNGLFGNGIYRMTDLFHFFQVLKYWIYCITN